MGPARAPQPSGARDRHTIEMRPIPLPQADDRSLARRVLERGDERAFRTLYRRHTPAMHRFVLRVLGGDGPEAEDVIQETWVRAVGKLAGFRWEAELRSWLTAIALNLARESLRRRARRPSAPLERTAAPAAPPARDGERIDLERAIAGLPDGCRAVFVLHDLEGFTHEEIARRLEIAVGTSKSQLFDARRALRARLRPMMELRDA